VKVTKDRIREETVHHRGSRYNDAPQVWLVKIISPVMYDRLRTNLALVEPWRKTS